MAYAVENALYQWREGERRIAESPRARPGRPPGGRRRGRGGAPRAGSARASWWTSWPSCTRSDTDWALEIAGRHRAGTDAAGGGGRRLRAVRPRGEGLRRRPAAREARRSPSRSLARPRRRRSCARRPPPLRNPLGPPRSRRPARSRSIVIVFSYLSPGQALAAAVGHRQAPEAGAEPAHDAEGAAAAPPARPAGPWRARARGAPPAGWSASGERSYVIENLP